MSDAVGKGDRVECINALPHRITGASWLVVGGVYVIAAIAAGRTRSGGVTTGLVLEGAPQEVWATDRFKPYRPGELVAKLFGQHLEVTPKKRVPA
jgi:hypothetical protein